jgi:hypothetical protein
LSGHSKKGAYFLIRRSILKNPLSMQFSPLHNQSPA